MKIIKTIAAVTVIALSTSAFAGGPEEPTAPLTSYGFYAGVEGGAAFLSGNVYGFNLLGNRVRRSISDFVNTGFDGGVQVGYRFTNNFRIEAEADYIYHGLKGTNNDANFNIVPLMANAYYDINTNSPWIPYIGVGAGAVDSSVTFRDPNFRVTSRGTWQFAYQGIAGIDYQVSQHVRVGINYHFMGWTKSWPNNGVLSNNTYENRVKLELNYYF